MLMVVLGAGASRDLAGMRSLNQPWLPPLTDDLVGNTPSVQAVLNGIPDRAASGLVSELRKTLSSGGLTLETALDQIAGSTGQTTREFVAFRLFIRDYMRSVSEYAVSNVGGATNQSHLVRRIEQYRQRTDGSVLYVTFNYDTILDQALSGQYGWHPVNDPLDRYLADSRFSLIKLHGSCDWSQVTELPVDGWMPGRVWRDSDVPAFKLQLLKAADRGLVSEGDEYRASYSTHDGPDAWVERPSISPDPITRLEATPPFLRMPAVAVPLGTKARFACPSRHVQRLDAALSKVDLILTVGWKAGEPLFLKRLKLVPPGGKVLAVNRSDASRRYVTDALGAVIGNVRPIRMSGDSEWAFTDLMAGDLLDDFLGHGSAH
jgi:hypothetical protein